MRPVQTTQDGDHQRPGGATAGAAQGILDDPDGVTRLYNIGRVIAKLYTVRTDAIDGFYKLKRGEEEGAYRIEWRRWTIPRLVWSHGSSMLFLQGATLQQIVAPFFMLAGAPRHASDPEPGLDNVVLVELYAMSSNDLTYPELFQLLAPEARGA